jgi:hypothetical protein
MHHGRCCKEGRLLRAVFLADATNVLQNQTPGGTSTGALASIPEPVDELNRRLGARDDNPRLPLHLLKSRIRPKGGTESGSLPNGSRKNLVWYFQTRYERLGAPDPSTRP